MAQTLEERVAALEAQLEALSAAAPTSYYTSKYSGEEMDALLDQVEPLKARVEALETPPAG